MRTPQKLPSGRYRVRFRLRGTQSSETFTRLADARRFAQLLDALGTERALSELYGNPNALNPAPPLDDLAADHIRLLTGVEPGTRLTYQRLWARTWGPLLGATPADLIRRDHIAQAVNTLAGRYSSKSLANQRGLLSAVLQRAVEQGHLEANPARGMRLPRGGPTGEEPEEMVFLTRPEWAVLYEAMDPWFRPLLRFLVGTGARWGEAVVVRGRDLDLERRTVRFRRALKHSPDGNRYVGVTKTPRSTRTVALPGEVAADLAALVRGPEDLVFVGRRGAMVAHRSFWSDHWRPALWRAQHCPDHTDPGCRCGTAHPERCKVHAGAGPEPCGCPGTIRVSPRIHDLRHTHASWLLGEGVPIHVVQARLGHESITTTVDRYGHLLPDAQLAAAAAADQAFGGGGLSRPRPRLVG